jgi:hypothetical protein
MERHQCNRDQRDVAAVLTERSHEIVWDFESHEFLLKTELKQIRDQHLVSLSAIFVVEVCSFRGKKLSSEAESQ